MSYKVAIAISGAVSLGAYEAGTMFEIIDAIRCHNNDSQADEEQIKIDVLTGASAGGMTAAMMAQKLLFESEELEGEYTNVGYKAWVKLVDIDGLLQFHEGDNKNTSLLSSGFVDKIAQNIILSRYSESNAPNKNPHPSCGKTIKLGLALSNLNGVDYSRNIFVDTHEGLVDGKFVETRHQDRLTVTLDENNDNKQQWQVIARSSLACGAFPVAFSPVTLNRKWNEPDYSERGADDFTEKFSSGKFTCIDGGAFNNYPLGMARELAKSNDDDPLDYVKRFYFYISPSKKLSSMDIALDGDGPEFFLQNAIISSVKAIFAQGRFQEWMITDKINKSITQLDERALQLATYVQTITDTEATELAHSAKALAKALYVGNKDDESLTEALSRLVTQYSEDYNNFGNASQDRQDAWIYSIAVFEKSAGLNDRDIMSVYTITATPEELASEQLVAFMGFFEESFRHYDYERGRLNALKMIANIVDQRQKNPTSDVHLPLKLDLTKIKTKIAVVEESLRNQTLANGKKLSEATIDDVPKATRDKVYQQAKKRFYLVAQNAELSWSKRVILYNFVVKKKLKSFLGL